MKTVKLFALLLFTAFTFHGASLQAAQVINGKQTRQVSGFHGISVSSGIDLQITQKNIEEVIVEADSDDQDKIITKVEDGILKIYMREKSWPSLNWNNKRRKVFVSFKTLDQLQVSAGSDVNAPSALKSDKLNVDVSSGSHVKLELDANELHVETSSGSDVSLNGKATVFHASASSGSDIDAGALESNKCFANASSGSNIKVNVTGELDANASSGGDITYTGNPKTKNVRESSGGDVSGK